MLPKTWFKKIYPPPRSPISHKQNLTKGGRREALLSEKQFILQIRLRWPFWKYCLCRDLECTRTSPHWRTISPARDNPSYFFNPSYSFAPRSVAPPPKGQGSRHFVPRVSLAIFQGSKEQGVSPLSPCPLSGGHALEDLFYFSFYLEAARKMTLNHPQNEHLLQLVSRCEHANPQA